MTTLVSSRLANELGRAHEFDAAACMDCGVCSAVCPLDIELLPRRLFRHVLLGMEARLLAETETIYSCLLCGLCEESCPGGVRITENVRALRHFLNKNAVGGAS
jgi:heterodisulfide reductase subunit C